MLRLIKASLIRYLKSPFLIVAFLCSLVLGIIHGVNEWRFIHQDLESYNTYVWLVSPMSDIWFKCSIWVLIVLVSLEIGKEFSEGTIRNKLYIGHTRMSIYLSEMISCLIMVLISYLMFMIPTLIGGRYFFSELSTVACMCLLGELLLFFAVWGIFSAVLSMLITNRAVGVVAVFSVMLFFAVINANLRSYYYNTDPAEITSTVVEISEDGKPYSFEETEKNTWYLDGIPKALVNIEHEVDPFSRSYNACNYAYIHYPEKAESAEFEMQAQINRQLKEDVLILILTIVIFIVGGSFLFQKKDLK
ncbi:MAG: ABC transporter permease [Ruminococcus sp.]|uniref:ABC transporter permease subunit n=1 Tax=Ruminococcus sp. TaxID=41978 RepID=UPI0025EAC55F|nr:ABC transporter permease subunit [Ruminococcus sp.]MCR5539574.1 ABC transporter permease [Ruminococcus sp.]